jgi:hypothetical protein
VQHCQLSEVSVLQVSLHVQYKFPFLRGAPQAYCAFLGEGTLTFCEVWSVQKFWRLKKKLLRQLSEPDEPPCSMNHKKFTLNCLSSSNQLSMHHSWNTKLHYLTNTPTCFGACRRHPQAVLSYLLNFPTHQMNINTCPNTYCNLQSSHRYTISKTSWSSHRQLIVKISLTPWVLRRWAPETIRSIRWTV